MGSDRLQARASTPHVAGCDVQPAGNAGSPERQTGVGINFHLIFEIGHAERTVEKARAKLSSIQASAKE
jgi:hypothetical protein